MIETPKEDPPSGIGAYRIVRLISEGSYARLYEAESPNSPGRRYVLKVLRPRPDSQDLAEWFASVATAINSLDHPNILPCHSFVPDDECCYMVLPFVDGRDLREIVFRDGVLEPAQLLQIVDSTARALDYAHGHGVVHSNLHPAHILLDDAQVRLIGFATYTRERPLHTLGNPHHLAPEQISSGRSVTATDVYALAEVSYLCLCGYFPFGGQDTLVMVDQKKSGPIPSIRERRPELSKRLDEVLQRGMAIQPDDRYSSAGKFAEALSAVF